MFRYVALWLLCVLPSLAPAQQVTGSITGSVVDPTGSAIAGAAVKLASEATAAVRTAATDAEGNFVFTAVTPGIYTVSAEQPGFKKFEKQHLELVPGDTLAVGSLKLEVGAVSESVMVRAEGAAVQTSTSERSGIVTSNEIQDLTVINRDYTTFASLQPGVVMTAGAEVQTFTGQNTFNVLGGRTTGNNFLIDGVPASNSNQGNFNTTLSLDATQTVEVKVANFDAEYGRNQGMTIVAVSKGGTQQVHGGAYMYDRNEGLNANNFFSNKQGLKADGSMASPRQKYRISNMGGTLGGPLRIPHFPSTKGKLFFFVASEEIREVRPKAAQTITVPTAIERKGDFSQSNTTAGKLIPVKDPLTGVAFPGNIVPASRILQSTQNYLNLLPLPNFLNTAVSAGNYNYYYQESLNVPKRIETGRLDYNMSSNTTMYARFNYWFEDQSGAAVSAGNSAWGWFPDHYRCTTPSGVVSLTHIINATTVLQATMGFQRFNEAGSPLSEEELAAKSRTTTGVNIPQFHPEINPYNVVPAASFGGVTSTSSNSVTWASRFPLRGVENTFNWNGTINKVAGSHTLKAGFYAERWRAMKGFNASNFAGTMAFGTDTNNAQDTGYAYSNALLGILLSYTESSSRPPLYEFTTNADWFAQDTWKVSRNLTLNLGVRFAWSQPWHSVQNLEAGFVPSLWDPSQVVKLIQPTMSGGKRMGLDPFTGQILPAVNIGAIAPESKNSYNGIVYRITNPSWPQGLRYTDGVKTSPRIGFAWDPVGNGKTVIRGGGGFFYDTHDRDNYQSSIQYTPPIQLNPVINYTTVQTFIGQAQYVSPSSISGYDPNRHIQMTMNFSFGIQRDIGNGTVLDVAYVGALGRHLLERFNLNSTPLGTNYQPQNLDSTNSNKVLPSQYLRPYLGFADIYYYTFGANSSYHSLQATLRRRYKNNLTYNVIYTWSKAMDYADDDASGATETVSSLIAPRVWNYGKAGFDRTHIFRFAWNYNLPRASSLVNGNKLVKSVLDGWQISGIVTFQSGAPLSITTSYSPSQDITGSTDTGRAILVADPVLARSNRTIYQAFNTAAITAPAYSACENAHPSILCWGNAPKDVFRGPGINNVDTSLFKNFAIHERLRGQLRVEAYNVFNHTNFSGVDTTARFDANGAQTNLTFGQYNAAQFPRRLQLVLRFSF
ncbi:MAG: carboxypeptidase regulatory-like domain-containing protein [Bryobacteraceae bacterium]|jgi:hypothetical protein